MMKNYRVFAVLWIWFVGVVAWVTLLWGLAPAYVYSATLYRCPGVDGVPQFQQTRCAAGAEVQLDDNALPWRGVTTPKKTKKRRTKKKRSKATKKVAQKKRASEAACWRAEKRRDKAARALRRGYKAGKGARLRQRRRDAEDYLRRFCQ